MTKLDALKELAAKIETGTARPSEVFAGFDTPCQDFALQQRADHAKNAYEGSLDAAKALHEVVLPGWHWGKYAFGDCVYILDNTADDEAEEFEADIQDNPARAWLLAILHALISREESA